jgi:hypothetical protein
MPITAADAHGRAGGTARLMVDRAKLVTPICAAMRLLRRSDAPAAIVKSNRF